VRTLGRRKLATLVLLLLTGTAILLAPRPHRQTPTQRRAAPAPFPPSGGTEDQGHAATSPSPPSPSDATPRRHLRVSADDLTSQEKAEFEKEFATKLKPAVERWCRVYAGRIPFRPEDVTAERLRERVGTDPDFYDYGFAIDGATLSVADNHGHVCVAYLMAPSAKALFQMPKNPPPPAEPSVTKQEILRLLKEDSGMEFPPSEVAIRPTSRSSSMNGGVSVDVGKNVNGPLMPLPKYGLVFGPDGKLVCYLKNLSQ
jgi:hypothetical protein